MASGISDELQGTADAYVLGALPEGERAQFAALLQGNDAAALAALTRAEELTGLIATAIAPETPPAHLKQRLMEQIPAPAPVAKFPAPPARARASVPAWAWVAAAALMVGIGVSWFGKQTAEAQLAAAMDRIEQLRSSESGLRDQNARYERMLSILSAADTRAVSLAAPANAQIHVYWNDNQGLLLAGTGMPQPQGDRTLQLWVIPRQGNPISVDIFRPSAGGEAIAVFAPPIAIGEAAALAITDEAAGGAPQPTSTPIWAGTVG